MNKSRIALVALIVLCLALLSVGTAAYFTVQDTAYNVISTATLDMVLEEKTTNGMPEGTPLDQLPDFEDAFGVMPGEEVSKIVYVRNSGTADFYTRVKFDLAITKDGQELDAGVVSLDISPEWTEKDGWYYYNGVVAAGENTVPLFTTVTFDTQMDNPYQNAETTILVKAQAVQSRNNGTSALTAAGWPAVVE